MSKKRYPIKHWSHSSLVSFLRNPLAWYKRYVEGIYDTPRTPASIVGSAGHLALENFYIGNNKEESIKEGLDYIRSIPEFEINFGKAETIKMKKEKRAKMEKEYLQAINYYLEKPPKHKVLGVEVKGIAKVKGLPIPLKAVSDLVVESKIDKKGIDIIDHKFVDSFSPNSIYKGVKTLFSLQAIFNYYVVLENFKRPVKQFVIYECKKRKNSDGSSQLKKYTVNFADYEEEFNVFNRLIKDATAEISRKRLYLPNPSDMFEGENSFDIYRMGLVDEE